MDDRKNLPEHEALIRRVSATPQNQFAEFTEKKLLYHLVKRVCSINGLDFQKVLQNPGPVVTTILTVWYKSHIADGGLPDPVMEELKSQGSRLN